MNTHRHICMHPYIDVYTTISSASLSQYLATNKLRPECLLLLEVLSKMHNSVASLPAFQSSFKYIKATHTIPINTAYIYTATHTTTTHCTGVQYIQYSIIYLYSHPYHYNPLYRCTVYTQYSIYIYTVTHTTTTHCTGVQYILNTALYFYSHPYHYNPLYKCTAYIHTVNSVTLVWYDASSSSRSHPPRHEFGQLLV